MRISILAAAQAVRSFLRLGLPGERLRERQLLILRLKTFRLILLDLLDLYCYLASSRRARGWR
ncbi:hypothetical protein NXT3_PB00498 (plasmid) [Sinorhizobium fredii]|uniref:Uncharacterized protein n=1 Tax=Rhizobium fredii TaxID=380 RepID=A0A2L0HEF0_RHIFR|nr:hypothetical protein NXT3_PB00498 [Sinorhizobium fredii]